eukprot:CAMPEP_0197892548 /NCGR_PEP_ID=MMETSP1439-20131203/30784_1 /TAXON_ID=66791 /ORGANISM="Gonyaulax spinifera, Strain CCMP409" /LENGTH=167 /DNA_ID=CAMNT_0043512733 /DNA_START=23 /DNA_END=526 /DNA_ORIENTATION=-
MLAAHILPSLRLRAQISVRLGPMETKTLLTSMWRGWRGAAATRSAGAGATSGEIMGAAAAGGAADPCSPASVPGPTWEGGRSEMAGGAPRRNSPPAGSGSASAEPEPRYPGTGDPACLSGRESPAAAPQMPLGPMSSRETPPAPGGMKSGWPSRTSWEERPPQWERS